MEPHELDAAEKQMGFIGIARIQASACHSR
jgi:hypothetical protein